MEAWETLIHADVSVPELQTLQTLNSAFQQEVKCLNCIQMGKKCKIPSCIESRKLLCIVF